MKNLFADVLSVDGFGDIKVEITQWIRFCKNDMAIIGITFKGEAVDTETNFKSVQGINIGDYSNFDPRLYAIEFIKSETLTKPLPSIIQPQTLHTGHSEFDSGQLSLSF